MIFKEIYEEYGKAVYRFCLSLTGNPDEAEELMQETFYRAFLSAERFEGRSTVQHQRQIKAMLKDPLNWSRKKARPVWKMVAQKVAIVLLVISVGFGTVMVASPTARAAFERRYPF